MKKLNEQRREALAGMDARPGPSSLPQSYFDKVFPPKLAKKVRDARAKPASF